MKSFLVDACIIGSILLLFVLSGCGSSSSAESQELEEVRMFSSLEEKSIVVDTDDETVVVSVKISTPETRRFLLVLRGVTMVNASNAYIVRLRTEGLEGSVLDSLTPTTYIDSINPADDSWDSHFSLLVTVEPGTPGVSSVTFIGTVQRIAGAAEGMATLRLEAIEL